MVQSRAGTPGVIGLVVRMPEDLRDRIKAAADENGRSQNSEIVATLEEKYPPPVEGMTLETLREWAKDVGATKNGRERTRLINEVNRKLDSDPRWRGWRLGMMPVPDENGKPVTKVAFYRFRSDEDVPSDERDALP